MKEEKFPHTRKPLHWWRRGWRGGSFRATEESTATGVQRAKQRDPCTENQCREACLLTRWGGWGLGADVQASEVRSQGEDWGWLREDSLKGASASQLAGSVSRKRSGTA